MQQAKLKQLIRELQYAQNNANFIHVSFEQLVNDVSYPRRESEVNDFIKSRTLQHRKKNIFDPIGLVMAELRKELK